MLRVVGSEEGTREIRHAGRGAVSATDEKEATRHGGGLAKRTQSAMPVIVDGKVCLPHLWCQGDVANRLSVQNQVKSTIRSSIAQPMRDVLESTLGRVRSNMHEMSAVPRVKRAMASAIQAERKFRKNLDGPTDVSTERALQSSLQDAFDESAAASNRVHDFKTLVDYEEKRLEHEYDRCVRRMKNERAALKRSMILPTERRFDELRKKMDRYEGLAICPCVQYAAEVCVPVIREAKLLASESLEKVLKSLVSSKGSISYKRLEIARKRVEEHAILARNRVDELENAMKEEMPHLLDRLRRDAEQRDELQGQFLHSQQLLEKIENVRNRNFSLRSFPYLNGFIENARTEVDLAATRLAKTTGLESNRAFRLALKARRNQILRAVEYTDRALTVLRKIDLSVAKNVMSKVHAVIDRNRDRGALHELSEVQGAVRAADKHMIETSNRLVWLVRTFSKKPWELKDRMAEYSAQVKRARELSLRALKTVRAAEIYANQEYDYRQSRDAAERSKLGETIPMLNRKLEDAKSIVESHRHLGVDAIELEDLIEKARAIVSEATTTHQRTYKIHVASARREFDARIRRMHVVVEEAVRALSDVQCTADRHDVRAKRIKDMQRRKDCEQRAEIRELMEPGKKLLEKIHDTLEEDAEIVQLVSRLTDMDANKRAEHAIELIQTRLDAATRRTSKLDERLDTPLTRDLTEVSKRSPRKRRGTTFVLNVQDTTAGEMRREATAAVALVRDVYRMVQERKATILAQRVARKKRVDQELACLRTRLTPVQTALTRTKRQMATSFRYGEQTIPTVKLSVDVAEEAIETALRSFENVDMSSDATASDSLNVRRDLVNDAGDKVSQLALLVDSIDLSSLRRRLLFVRSDIESSPHGTMRSQASHAAIENAFAKIEAVATMSRAHVWWNNDGDGGSETSSAGGHASHITGSTTTMKPRFPIPVLAFFLWTTVAPELPLAWHAVAKKVGWISEAEKLLARGPIGVGTLSTSGGRGRTRKRRESRFMQSTASSRKQNNRRRRRSTLNVQNIEMLTLEAAVEQLETKVEVTKFGYDRKERGRSSKASAYQAALAASEALRFAKNAELALTGGDAFREYILATVRARDAVRNAERVVAGESERFAALHRERRRKLRNAKEEVIAERIDPAQRSLAFVIESLRHRWDGLGGVRRLLDAIALAKRNLEDALGTLARISSKDPTTEKALGTLIAELFDAADAAISRVRDMRTVYDEEDARLADRRKLLEDSDAEEEEEGGEENGSHEGGC
eukprot:g2372.t1